MEDRNEELERIERELLAEEPQDLDRLMKEFLEEPLQDTEDVQTLQEEVAVPAFDGGETIVIPTEPAPAFDDPDQTVIPTDPVVYCNYSNDYGKDLQSEVDVAALRKKKRDDNTIITLLAVAAGLSLGIIGVLVYWLVKFF